MSVVGENIRKYRLLRGLTLTQLADAVGESKQTIYKYETGIITNIPLVKIETIANTLKCTPEAIVGWGAKDQDHDNFLDRANGVEPFILSLAGDLDIAEKIQQMVDAGDPDRAADYYLSILSEIKDEDHMLIHAWHQADAKEKRIIAGILEDYGFSYQEEKTSEADVG